MRSNSFPRGVGGDGSGKVVAVGNGVTDFKAGDEDYGYAFGSVKGGFFAEYVAALTNTVAHLPEGVDLLHGAALAIPSTTALRGLTTALGLKSGQSVGTFGATGAVGWPAVQLAKAMGVKVLAVASGQERVEHARRDSSGASSNSIWPNRASSRTAQSGSQATALSALPVEIRSRTIGTTSRP